MKNQRPRISKRSGLYRRKYKGKREREKEKWKGEGKPRGSWEGRNLFDLLAGWKSSVAGWMWMNVCVR